MWTGALLLFNKPNAVKRWPFSFLGIFLHTITAYWMYGKQNAYMCLFRFQEWIEVIVSLDLNKCWDYILFYNTKYSIWNICFARSLLLKFYSMINIHSSKTKRMTRATNNPIRIYMKLYLFLLWFFISDLSCFFSLCGSLLRLGSDMFISWEFQFDLLKRSGKQLFILCLFWALFSIQSELP